MSSTPKPLVDWRGIGRGTKLHAVRRWLGNIAITYCGLGGLTGRWADIERCKTCERKIMEVRGLE